MEEKPWHICDNIVAPLADALQEFTEVPHHETAIALVRKYDSLEMELLWGDYCPYPPKGEHAKALKERILWPLNAITRDNLYRQLHPDSLLSQLLPDVAFYAKDIVGTLHNLSWMLRRLEAKRANMLCSPDVEEPRQLAELLLKTVDLLPLSDTISWPDDFAPPSIPGWMERFPHEPDFIDWLGRAASRLAAHADHLNLDPKPLLCFLCPGDATGFWDAQAVRAAKLMVHQLQIRMGSYAPPAQIQATPVVKAHGTSKPKKKRRRRIMSGARLTERQRVAMELYHRFDGKITAIAREMGISHPTVIQHLDAAWAKLPGLAPNRTTPTGKAKRLPTDRRGQTDLADDGDAES